MVKWYCYGLATAVLVGLLASLVSSAGWTPVGVYSLGVGLAIGGPVTKLPGVVPVTWTKRLLTGTVLMAICTVIAQHAWLYNDYRRQWHVVQNHEPALAIFRPGSAPLSPT